MTQLTTHYSGTKFAAEVVSPWAIVVVDVDTDTITVIDQFFLQNLQG